MTYKIKVEYSTGDSFRNWDETQILEHKWKNIDIAKENLQRIKDHYLWAKKVDEEHWGHKDWKKKHDKWMKKKPTFADKKYPEFSMSLLDDNRNEFKIHVSWTGYFESLYGASIVADKEDGWSFSL